MKKILVVTLSILSLFAGNAIAEEKRPPVTYRYKLTVEFDTPDGVKSGSSVIEVKHESTSWDKDRATAIGDAVFIDLGRGKNAVALLAHGYDAVVRSVISLAPRAFIYNTLGKPTVKNARKMSALIGQEKVLERSLLPTMVTFADLNKPESAELLYAGHHDPRYVHDPRFLRDDIDRVSKVLGEGYKFKSAKIKITDEAIVRNIEKHLPWVIDQYKSGTAHGKIAKGYSGSAKSSHVFLAEGISEYVRSTTSLQ